MTTASEDVRFVAQTDEGPVQAVISRSVLSRLSGRSHVSADQLLEIYQAELADLVQRKVRRHSSAASIRIEASDL